jgi:hypothetical protein
VHDPLPVAVAKAPELSFHSAFTLAFLYDLSKDAFYRADVNGTGEHIKMLHRIARERAKVKTDNNLKMLHLIENNLFGEEGAKQYRKDRRDKYANARKERKEVHTEEDKASYKKKTMDAYLAFIDSLPGHVALDLALVRPTLSPIAKEFSPEGF